MTAADRGSRRFLALREVSAFHSVPEFGEAFYPTNYRKDTELSGSVQRRVVSLMEYMETGGNAREPKAAGPGGWGREMGCLPIIKGLKEFDIFFFFFFFECDIF